MKRDIIISVAILLVAMASIQVGASFAKPLFPMLGVIVAAILRLFFATLILFVIWKPWKLWTKLSPYQMKMIALYGASLGWMNLCFYMSLNRIPLGVAVALEFTGPLAVALISSRKPLDFLWALLAALGILKLLSVPSLSSLPLDKIGVLYALGAASCWAFYIIFGQKLAASSASLDVSLTESGQRTAIGMLVAFLVVLPFTIPSLLIGVSFDSHNLSLAFFVAFLSSALPYSLEMLALKNVPIKTFGILMSLEPVMAALSGFYFLGERLSLAQWSGIFCIIAASAGSSLTASAKALSQREEESLT